MKIFCKEVLFCWILPRPSQIMIRNLVWEGRGGGESKSESRHDLCGQKMRFSWLEWTTNMLLTERTVRVRDWTPATDLVQIMNAITIFVCDFWIRSPLSHHQRMRRHQINLTSLVVARRDNYHSWCIMWRSNKRHYATVYFGITSWGSVFVPMIWLTSSMFNGKVNGYFFLEEWWIVMHSEIDISFYWRTVQHESLLYSSESRILEITSINFFFQQTSSSSVLEKEGLSVQESWLLSYRSSSFITVFNSYTEECQMNFGKYTSY